MNIQELLLEKRSIDNLKITSEGRRRCLTCQKEYNKNNWKRYADRRIR